MAVQWHVFFWTMGSHSSVHLEKCRSSDGLINRSTKGWSFRACFVFAACVPAPRSRNICILWLKVRNAKLFRCLPETLALNPRLARKEGVAPSRSPFISTRNRVASMFYSIRSFPTNARYKPQTQYIPMNPSFHSFFVACCRFHLILDYWGDIAIHPL